MRKLSTAVTCSALKTLKEERTMRLARRMRPVLRSCFQLWRAPKQFAVKSSRENAAPHRLSGVSSL